MSIPVLEVQAQHSRRKRLILRHVQRQMQGPGWARSFSGHTGSHDYWLRYSGQNAHCRYKPLTLFWHSSNFLEKSSQLLKLQNKISVFWAPPQTALGKLTSYSSHSNTLVGLVNLDLVHGLFVSEMGCAVFLYVLSGNPSWWRWAWSLLPVPNTLLQLWISYSVSCVGDLFEWSGFSANCAAEQKYFIKVFRKALMSAKIADNSSFFGVYSGPRWRSLQRSSKPFIADGQELVVLPKKSSFSVLQSWFSAVDLSLKMSRSATGHLGYAEPIIQQLLAIYVQLYAHFLLLSRRARMRSAAICLGTARTDDTAETYRTSSSFKYERKCFNYAF